MNSGTADRARELQTRLSQLDTRDADYAADFVELVLDGSQAMKASDLHFQPTADGLEVRWRLDGVLQQVGVFSSGETADVVSRLKVLAELLTYRTDVPQEGRLREQHGNTEIRVSTFPTLHGERAVVRLFAADDTFSYLHDLGMPEGDAAQLSQLLHETSGAILATGPAGSGKTTTAYACLRELVRRTAGGQNIVSLEDPIEVAVEGVAQSQVHAAAGFTLASGLKSLLRQDPEVILVGEIRDPETAEGVFQACLTGHLVITTFHAGSAVEAIRRLSDMRIEGYQLRSGILAIVSQRLLRRLCTCAEDVADEEEKLGLPVRRARRAAGCGACLQTGYRGRTVLAELLVPSSNDLSRELFSGVDALQLETAAIAGGMKSIWQRGCEAVEEGWTSPAEFRRVLGFSERRKRGVDG